ncbi:hypothetical protein PR048_006187 [Dryococelus australis]|uniref:Uncharacterized protein n=1 Tax=Dryococelus australis TaxID=614101 RepID=A0ABQ9IAU3_9NEOP|nr:hypothetical protein PR048_006187 [Dryococelus australis]
MFVKLRKCSLKDDLVPAATRNDEWRNQVKVESNTFQILLLPIVVWDIILQNLVATHSSSGQPKSDERSIYLYGEDLFLVRGVNHHKTIICFQNTGIPFYRTHGISPEKETNKRNETRVFLTAAAIILGDRSLVYDVEMYPP